DLRDHTGICQLVLRPEAIPDAHALRNEFVVRATGEVVARAPEAVNPNLPTGEVEIQVDTLRILSRSTPLPFQLDEENVDETLRLRYRWLDLRRDKLQRNIRLRGKMVGTIRRVMEGADFIDIQTPILWKPTPEGARDFLVPARLQKGRFYALPQSPQIAKQLLVIANFERYYQIAICFRDEDLRADRVQEITQLDVEMAFPDKELIYALMEEMIQTIWRECVGVEVEIPLPRMTWTEADARFGSDKPDTRFGLELQDATAITRGSQFGVFANAEAVRFIVVDRELSRAELDRLEQFAKEWGAKGLAYIVRDAQGEVRSPIAKFLSEEELAALEGPPGSTLLFAADAWETTSRVLGALRLHLAEELGLIEEGRFDFLWVEDFPMFEWHEDEGRWGAVHHPFTRPLPDWEDRFDADPAHALANAYDLIANGNELGGGSFRIHEPEMQSRVFDLLQIDAEQQRAKFGFLLDALGMGAPPHGGIAFGIDRMTMVLAGEPNLRDVIAFPKNQAGVDPMTGAPSDAPAEQLAELGLAIVAPPQNQEGSGNGR
ncbi:MAG: aspartyl-tRNA synthetase, partial [Gaiellaceae bacterium]|nr:aspartyl-tRNA synthetase [Gaiellaceae bacterium]